MADEVIQITLNGRIDPKIAGGIIQIADAADRADSSLDELRNTLKSFNLGSVFKGAVNDVRELRNEVNRATQTQRTLTTAVSQTSAEYVKGATNARKYAAEVSRINDQTRGVTRSTGELRGAVGSLVGAFASIYAVQQYAAAQDTLTSVQNQIRAVAAGAEDVARLQEKLFNLARETRSGIESTTTAFVNFNKNLSVIGATEQEVFRIVETLNKGFIVSGKSAAEAAGSTRQFIQGLQNGALRGEEFNSVMEGFPVEIIRAFADELGVSQTELRKMAEQGLITADVIRGAMNRAASDIDSMFNKTIPTIGNALTELNNQFIKFTGSSSGAAQLLAQSIYLIADNLNIVIPIIAAFAGAWAAVKLVQIVADFGALVKTVYGLAAAFTAANAVALAWVGIGATILAGVVALHYAWQLLNGEVESFDEYLGNMIEQGKGAAAAIGELVGGTQQQAAASAGASQALAGQTAATTTATTANMQMNDGIIDLNMTTEEFTKQVKANAAAQTDWAAKTVEAVEKVKSAYDSVIDKVIRNGKLTKEDIANYAADLVASKADIVRRPNNLNTVTSPQNYNNLNTNIKKFNSGGSSMVRRGSTGGDRNLIMLRANKGERVDVLTPKQQREESRGSGSTTQNFYFNVQTPDADSFQLSRSQMARNVAAALS